MGGGEDSWLVGMYSLSGPEIPNKQVLTATARSEWTFVIPWTCTSESHQSVFSNTRTDVLKKIYNTGLTEYSLRWLQDIRATSSRTIYRNLKRTSIMFISKQSPHRGPQSQPLQVSPSRLSTGEGMKASPTSRCFQTSERSGSKYKVELCENVTFLSQKWGTTSNFIQLNLFHGSESGLP